MICRGHKMTRRCTEGTRGYKKAIRDVGVARGK